MDSTKYVTFPDNLRSVAVMKKHVNMLLMGRDVDSNLSIRVLAVGLGMQEDYLLAKKNKKNKKGGVVEAPKFQETLCKQFCISKSTLTNITQDYLLHLF